jgi:hypothetical protein
MGATVGAKLVSDLRHRTKAGVETTLLTCRGVFMEQPFRYGAVNGAGAFLKKTNCRLLLTAYDGAVSLLQRRAHTRAGARVTLAPVF